MLPNDIYARAFASAQTGLLLLESSTSRILEANTAFLEISGYRINELIGCGFWELIADREAGAEVQAHLRSGGVASGVDLPFRSPDGRWLVLEINGAPAGDSVLLELRNVTGREEARIAARMETLRAQAGRTARELRGLHASLLAAGELLLIAAGQGRPVLRELSELQQATERAGGIACQLAAFSQQAELKPCGLSLGGLVESMWPRLRELFPPGVDLISDLTSDAAPVVADPAHIRQIILKLATNARDAMGAEGTFCVQTRDALAVEPGLGDIGGGPFGMLAMSDSGPGFDDESWEHLYEPFFSTKANGHLGLGLAAAYGVIRQSGGKLWTYSQPGKGATFRIYLPLAGAQFPVLAIGAGQAHPGITILLVEPHDRMRTTMANALKEAGYRVAAVLHTAEALRLALDQGPPDLLISGPAPELVERLTRLDPQLKVLYLGGYTDALLAQERGLPPRTGLLAKPFEPQTLLAKVSAMLF
jgi:two-component system, cell cycle sensor histidine kinase and response regulator CckA